MAEGGEIREIFDGLRQELENVSQTLTTQSVNQAVPNFDGTPSKFKEWIKAIDKYSILASLNNDKKKLVAYQTSTGAVSGFIERYIAVNQNCTLAELRAELAQRFAEIHDSRMAFSMLKFVRQGNQETIHSYAERILSIAKEAYQGMHIGPAIEQHMVDSFAEGLISPQLRMKILRDRPQTLQTEIHIASNETNLYNRVFGQHSHTQHKPMEVDHSKSLKCFKCGKRGHRGKDCKNVNSTENRRKIYCWGCGQEGHILKFCRQNENQEIKRLMGHGRGSRQNLN